MSSKDNSKKKNKNALADRSDDGWKHGVDVDGNGRKVQCKYCKKVVSGGIFRFKNHLACTRQDVEGCTSVPSEVKEQMMSILAKAAELTEKKRKQIHGIEDSDDDEVNQVAFKKREKHTTDFFFKKKSSGSGSGALTNQATMNQFLKERVKGRWLLSNRLVYLHKCNSI